LPHASCFGSLDVGTRAECGPLEAALSRGLATAQSRGVVMFLELALLVVGYEAKDAQVPIILER
jgi:hypothetical protein